MLNLNKKTLLFYLNRVKYSVFEFKVTFKKLLILNMISNQSIDWSSKDIA